MAIPIIMLTFAPVKQYRVIMEKTTKKQLVDKIRAKLRGLGIVRYGCVELNKVPNVFWVSMNRILSKEHIKSVVHQHVHYKLYSKHITKEMLSAILNELEGM